MMTSATGLRDFINTLREWWSFDNGQVHTHNWHSREDFIQRVLPKFSIEKKPSDGEEPITEGWLLSIGFEMDSHGQLRIARHWKHSPYPTYLILSDPANILDSPWSLQTYFDDGSWEGTMIAEEMKTRPQLLHLLAALGCDVDQPTNSGKAG